MAIVASNPSEYSLSSPNDATGWLSAVGIEDDIGFSLMGTFSATVSIDVSYQDDVVKTRYRTLPDVYTVPVGPLAIPRIAAPWFRFRLSTYASGIVYVGVSTPRRAGRDGTASPITTQPQGSGLGGDIF